MLVVLLIRSSTNNKRIKFFNDLAHPLIMWKTNNGDRMVKDINKKIGKRIAEFRKQSELSQSELAEQVKLSTEYISRLERGVNAPSIQTLNILADVLNVSIRDFLTFTDGEDWSVEIESLVVLLRNKKGKTIQKILKLSEVLDE